MKNAFKSPKLDFCIKLAASRASNMMNQRDIWLQVSAEEDKQMIDMFDDLCLKAKTYEELVVQCDLCGIPVFVSRDMFEEMQKPKIYWAW